MDEEKRKLSTNDIAAAEAADRPAERQAATRSGGAAAVTDAPAPLFANEEALGYRTRWDAIQTGFVDEPRRAVEEADALVADVFKHLAEGFARERTSLEQQWGRGGTVSTEDLRVALRRYRSFFQRLLAA